MPKKNKRTGPAQHYPDLGGKMVPVTIYMPPMILKEARESADGIGEWARAAFFAKSKYAKNPNKIGRK